MTGRRPPLARVQRRSGVAEPRRSIILPAEPAGGNPMRNTGIIATGAALLVAALPVPGAAQDADAALAIFGRLNDESISIYQDAKRRFLAAADPVIIVGPNSVLIRHGGGNQRVGKIPPAYQLLK